MNYATAKIAGFGLRFGQTASAIVWRP